MTQYNYLIQLLNERGEEGINSFERFNGKIKVGQLPARMYYLKRPPYSLPIITINKLDGSVTYILHQIQKQKDEYIFVGNKAILKSELKPEQLSI